MYNTIEKYRILWEGVSRRIAKDNGITWRLTERFTCVSVMNLGIMNALNIIESDDQRILTGEEVKLARQVMWAVEGLGDGIIPAHDNLLSAYHAVSNDIDLKSNLDRAFFNWAVGRMIIDKFAIFYRVRVE